MEEIWKDVQGYEDYYQISNFGRIKSKYYNRIRSYILNQGGYCTVQLCVKQKRKAFALHRLVAIHFIPNPLNLPEINHLDFNKENNKINNLEWCTPKQNSIHRTINGKSKGGAPKGNKNTSKHST
jgi:hypothetical protein